MSAHECSYIVEFIKRFEEKKQEGQVALNRSPEFCLKLTYRYLLKADHVPGDTSGKAIIGLIPGT